MTSMIRSATMVEATNPGGEWAFVDLGFASSAKSCGLLVGAAAAELHTFGSLSERLRKIVTESDRPIKLVIEAPLSIAFNAAGNPVGRSIELRGSVSRYWYVGLGCTVLVAAMHLLRSLTDAKPERRVCLIEGMVSFKQKGTTSNHADDVRLLQRIAAGDSGAGRVIAPEALAQQPTHELQSAFAVAGMGYGIPPLIVAGG